MAKIPYSREYEYVWKHYPKRLDKSGNWIKRKKYPGWLVWQKIDEDDQHDIICKAAHFKKKLGNYAPDIDVFLRNRGWDDIDFSKKYQPIWPEEFRTLFACIFLQPNVTLLQR